MKKKLSSKKCIALILAVVMVVTSIPFMMVGAEETEKYDPAPYFSEEDINKGADAWIDDDGNIQVSFPAATPNNTYKGEPKTIAFYVLELINMGEKTKVHSEKILKTIKVTGTSATFKASDISEKLDFETNRYSITITAVDSENWFSQPIYTTVTNVPTVKMNPEYFDYLSTSDTAVREIMTFDNASGSDSGTVSGNQLLYMGVAAETGTDDLTDNVGDTSALRFIMNDQPTGTQIFDTSYTRSTWDYKGATEMWYWMDLSDVELEGVSFRLRSNEKMWMEWNDDDETLDEVQRAGEIVYSTKGTAASTYTGTDPYVYVQREDGGWNKVMLNDDGTVDLGNFKGYVRVPLQFMCSEKDSYVDISNQELACGYNYKGSLWNGYPVDEDAINSWLTSMTFGKIIVDPAGTSITDALLIHRRGYLSSSGAIGTGTRHLFLYNLNGITHLTDSYPNNPSPDYSKTGYMLAVPLDPTKAKTSVTTGNVSTDRAYIANGTVQNREGGLKAIEDIYNAGFSIEGCSEESLQNSFYIDNIFFYRTDGGYYTDNSLNDTPDIGKNIETYYNEELAISKIIFDEIDEYIEEPDWSDYREIQYILDLVEAYRVAFKAKGKDTAFLDLSKNDADDGKTGVGLAYAAEVLGRDSWAVAWEAYEACIAMGTLTTANADKDELVPVIIRAMEKLPEPENITIVSDELRKEIIKIWKAYVLLNYGQLEMLGKAEEQEILKYIALLDSSDDNEFVVGQQLANYPYVVYNDFESMALGTEAYQIAENKNAFSVNYKSMNGISAGTHDPDNSVYTMADGWRHTKGFTTYTTNGTENVIDKDWYGYSPTDTKDDEEVMDGKVHYDAATVEVTDDGYLNSHAATMTIDSSFQTTSDYQGVFHTVTFTRNGKDASSYNEFKNNNTKADNLGALSTANATGTATIPLALIMYVDFTEISDFYFSTNVYGLDEGVEHKFRVDMGSATLGNITDPDAYKQEHWKYYILDPDTGEWVVNHTTSQYAFTSTKNTDWGDTLSLNNYRGYLMIPLYHIKSGEIVLDGSDKLDGNADWLNSIYAIQFCIGGKNADSLDGKSYTIDNIGFTYDPNCYSGVSHETYAEYFEAKSLPAKKFEDAVKAIDPYDASTITAKYNEALAMYNALSPFQKSKVQVAKSLLDSYAGYAADTSTIPAPDKSVADFTSYVNSLPEIIRTTAVSGETDIPHPGFTNGNVNYGTMGVDKATAEEIVRQYNESYSRYTLTQKNSLDSTVKEQFLNAYNMAMRMTQTLEDIRTEVITGDGTNAGFLSEITGLYTVKYDYNDDGVLENEDESVADSAPYKIGNFISIAGRTSVNNFKENKYEPLQYYSKYTMENGQIYSQLENTSRGFTYFLKNTQSYTIDGETIDGGILTFQKKMQDIYDMIAANTDDKKGHLTEKSLFSAEELQSIKDVLDEYNAFLPAYYNVEELYELAQQIIRAFPQVETEDVDVTEIMLSEDKLTGDKSTYKVTYSEVLDYDGSGEKYAVRVYSKNGAMVNDYGDTVAYSLAINSESKDSGAILEATPYEADVANNTYTPSNPWNIELVPSIDAKPSGIKGSVRDTLTVKLVHIDTVSETVDGVTTTKTVETLVDEQIVVVSYSMGDSYTVTIPAQVSVDWDTKTSIDVGYSVTSEMAATSKITVGVTDATTNFNADSNTGKLVANANNNLTYTATNFVETEFAGSMTNAEPTNKPQMEIAGWDDVPVGNYKTTLTYTVTYSDGTP